MVVAKSILVLKYGETQELTKNKFVFSGVKFQLIEVGIESRSKVAIDYIEQFADQIDAIAVEGVELHEVIGGGLETAPIRNLGRICPQIPFFESRTSTKFWIQNALDRIAAKDHLFLLGKSLLSHRGSAAIPEDYLVARGVDLQLGDGLVSNNIPLKVSNTTELKRVARMSAPVTQLTRAIPFSEIFMSGAAREILRRWMVGLDFLITNNAWVRSLGGLEFLSGKALIIDRLAWDLKNEVESLNGCKVIEYLPKLSSSSVLSEKGPATILAVVDIARAEVDSELSREQFLDRVETQKSSALLNVVPRCEKFAFVVHPLAIRDIFRAPSLRWLQRTPASFQNVSSHAMAQFPGFHYGTISGIRSALTGREALGEIYSLVATPKELMAMPVEALYQKLVKIAVDAKKRGCTLLGLGAYTKVVGDGGETVAALSPIPVTNGNSYSAASTLWAANAMIKELGIADLNPGPNGLRSGSAMIVGATGSIGRVSAILMSKVYSRIYLIATKPERLVLLQQEICEESPNCEVVIGTDANQFLPDCQVIVTATSNLSGKAIFDIQLVQPGAVICDCSRPLDITKEQAESRPDVLVIDGGEILLPGDVRLSCDIGLPKPVVYACLAETALLALEGRHESFSVGKELDAKRVMDIYRIGKRHGAELAEIQSPLGAVTAQVLSDIRSSALRVIREEKNGKKKKSGRSTAMDTRKTLAEGAILWGTDTLMP